MRIKKIIEAGLHILAILLFSLALMICGEAYMRPGTVNALEAKSRTKDSIDIRWEPADNASYYILSYREAGTNHWEKVKTQSPEYSLNDLKEGTDYDFAVVAGNDKREASEPTVATITTKRTQQVTAKPKQMKLAGTRKIEVESETDIKLESENESVASVNEDQTVELTPGTVTIKAEATETEVYESEETEIELEVIDNVSEEPLDAKLKTIYKLDESNCEAVLALKDSDVPQSFDYVDGEYVIAYGMNESKKIVKYDAEGNRKEYKTGMSIGHPNGFAYSDKGYTVQGWSSECTVCDIENNDYSKMHLARGASGIAYDKALDRYYTSSRTHLVAYDSTFSEISAITPVHRNDTYYTQDCGGHNGIMMRCLSDSTKHGINLIDLYDMVNGLYIGTVECDLSEVESAAVDEEGFMLLLCNTSKDTDYIYRTPINIGDLGQDIQDTAEADEEETVEAAPEPAEQITDTMPADPAAETSQETANDTDKEKEPETVEPE